MKNFRTTAAGAALLALASLPATAQGPPNFNGVMVPNAPPASSSVACSGLPALVGDVTTTAGSCTTALASSISGAKAFTTSVAVGGAAIGVNAFAVSGRSNFAGSIAITPTANVTPVVIVDNGLTGYTPTNANALELVTNGDISNALQIQTYSPTSTGGDGPFIATQFAYGTPSAPTAVGTGASLFGFAGRGYHSGGAYSFSTARIQFQTDQAFTATAWGTYMVFQTTAINSTVRRDVFRLMSSGNANVGAFAVTFGAAIGSEDVSASRVSAGLAGIGNGTPGSFAGSLKLTDIFTNNATYFLRTNTTLTDSAAAQIGTLTNAPAAGNPTKWISIDDNGTARKIPAW